MRVRRAIDVLGYVSWLTLVVILLFVPPSVYLGLGLAGIKIGLMIGGIVTLGYALVLLKPARPGTEEESEEPTSASREGVLGALPPWRWYPIAPEERVRPGFRIAAAGATMLLVSYLMEAAFGVRL